MPMIRTALCLAVLGLSLGQAQAATIEIQNRDRPGVGFNDPTPATPVGGNPGRTLGEQRMNVYRYVAGVWERALDSSIKITVSAGWEPLDCNATGAVLGSAMPYNVWYDFPGAPVGGTWYPQALANKISGRSLTDYYGQQDDGSGYGNVDIKTQFNINLGATGCLTGTTFYLGLDGQAGNQIDFAITLLHELGHGLGFSLLTTNASTGARFMGMPSIWESFMYDSTLGKTWLAMEDWERSYSAVNPLQLGWTGANVTTAVPSVLTFAMLPALQVSGSGAGAAAGLKQLGLADFGPALTTTPITGSIVRMADQINGTGQACAPLSSVNAALVSGRIALIDRGGCSFVQKVKNLQLAGAKAVLVADNVVEPIAGMSGTDPTITIPSVRILKTDGDAIKAALLNRVRGKPAPELQASLSASVTGQYAGTDSAGRPLLYTPAAFSPGSSVSHWDTTLTPNMLMEPFMSSNLTTVLTAPKDLTLPLLKDIGW
ncbi:MAG: peptidase [Roseateles depolymerans]|uniref:Peptidase n=1 Tax=Roseateles depolymerans TaxID=76731 RepID=A0A2W5DGW3_9BURK|nr:MAG: peptidase [Roseateles depolymerans]